MEATQLSINRWVDEKSSGVYIMQYYSVLKKNEILSFTIAWLDLEGINAKWDEPDSERQVSYDITYM